MIYDLAQTIDHSFLFQISPSCKSLVSNLQRYKPLFPINIGILTGYLPMGTYHAQYNSFAW